MTPLRQLPLTPPPAPPPAPRCVGSGGCPMCPRPSASAVHRQTPSALPGGSGALHLRHARRTCGEYSDSVAGGDSRRAVAQAWHDRMRAAWVPGRPCQGRPATARRVGSGTPGLPRSLGCVPFARRRTHVRDGEREIRASDRDSTWDSRWRTATPAGWVTRCREGGNGGHGRVCVCVSLTTAPPMARTRMSDDYQGLRPQAHRPVMETVVGMAGPCQQPHHTGAPQRPIASPQIQPKGAT